MSLHGKSSNHISIICEMLASFFESVYVADESEIDFNNPNRSLEIMEFKNIGNIYFECAEMLEALISIDTSKSIGPDKISPLLLHKCAESVAKPFIVNSII